MEHDNDWNFPFFENYVSITSNLWIPFFSATFWEDVRFLNDRCIIFNNIYFDLIFCNGTVGKY